MLLRINEPMYSRLPPLLHTRSPLNRVEARYVPAEDARLDPVDEDEHAVPPGHLLGQVDGAPEQEARLARALDGLLVHRDLRQRPVGGGGGGWSVVWGMYVGCGLRETYIYR